MMWAPVAKNTTKFCTNALELIFPSENYVVFCINFVPWFYCTYRKVHYCKCSTENVSNGVDFISRVITLLNMEEHAVDGLLQLFYGHKRQLMPLLKVQPLDAHSYLHGLQCGDHLNNIPQQQHQIKLRILKLRIRWDKLIRGTKPRGGVHLGRFLAQRRDLLGEHSMLASQMTTLWSIQELRHLKEFSVMQNILHDV
jgi:hypothetical protein